MSLLRLIRHPFIAIGLALLAPVLPVFAQTPVPAVTDATSQVITWDGTTGIALNALVGADRFYNAGIFGQSTVTANVEAGLIWNGHETTSTLSNYYVAPGAAGDFDMHATWVGSVLAGYNPSADGANYPYYQLGMAPLTLLSSGAIATSWYNSEDLQNTYFDITPKTFYSAYNHYFTTTWTHTVDLGGGISVGYSGPTDVINSSWGYTDPTGRDAFTMAADGLARAHPLTTLVISAGNSNTATNSSNNVGGPASGFNSISVGAVGNYTPSDFTTVADFSSRGPQDYYDPVHGLVPGVRAPVDLVAPGTSILSAYYGGQTGGNSATLATTQPDVSGGAADYYTLGLAGTSFAAPIVAGGVSLLKSASYQVGMGDESRDTRVIKAILMNSATKLPGWNNGQHLDGSGVTVTTQALDWSQGAGMLNLSNAFNQYLLGTRDVPGTGGGTIATQGWDLGVIEKSADTANLSHNDYRIEFTLQKLTVLNVTLTWFRNYADPIFTDNADVALQTLTTEDLGFANLYLEIWDANFTHLYARSATQYNNVQELRYTLWLDGEYGLRVTYADQMYGTPVPETYGLAWSAEAVPEPGAVVLLGLAMLVLGVACRYRAVTLKVWS